ncbi:hypothetical protein VOLCADRAFT_92183 [Volvox carteri f. nagariensis]|uniref:Uncharacterized protein n=1 Tax=Volvox carteri f. nagariensis TaxID=3068 RepID=D8TYU0_VOLCA|nr:uncharacterized protein VOLCADRAFT_92183 [Volvox carteri f. nagariensis]EFJ47451.1 hypothetical protein VOLCADRAFT_92183 [Volvox carteri f. nagariensis]|eukprot:XP_002951640.1 hypothetical protein VOLCADRAFT_92183 [Volvox carteri f. nagariensis]
MKWWWTAAQGSSPFPKEFALKAADADSIPNAYDLTIVERKGQAFCWGTAQYSSLSELKKKLLDPWHEVIYPILDDEGPAAAPSPRLSYSTDEAALRNAVWQRAAAGRATASGAETTSDPLPPPLQRRANLLVDMFGGVIAHSAAPESLCWWEPSPFFPLSRGGLRQLPNLLPLHAAAHRDRQDLLLAAVVRDVTEANGMVAAAAAAGEVAHTVDIALAAGQLQNQPRFFLVVAGEATATAAASSHIAGIADKAGRLLSGSGISAAAMDESTTAAATEEVVQLRPLRTGTSPAAVAALWEFVLIAVVAAGAGDADDDMGFGMPPAATATAVEAATPGAANGGEEHEPTAGAAAAAAAELLLDLLCTNWAGLQEGTLVCSLPFRQLQLCSTADRRSEHPPPPPSSSQHSRTAAGKAVVPPGGYPAATATATGAVTDLLRLYLDCTADAMAYGVDSAPVSGDGDDGKDTAFGHTVEEKGGAVAAIPVGSSAAAAAAAAKVGTRESNSLLSRARAAVAAALSWLPPRRRPGLAELLLPPLPLTTATAAADNCNRLRPCNDAANNGSNEKLPGAGSVRRGDRQQRPSGLWIPAVRQPAPLTSRRSQQQQLRRPDDYLLWPPQRHPPAARWGLLDARAAAATATVAVAEVESDARSLAAVPEMQSPYARAAEQAARSLGGAAAGSRAAAADDAPAVAAPAAAPTAVVPLSLPGLQHLPAEAAAALERAFMDAAAAAAADTARWKSHLGSRPVPAGTTTAAAPGVYLSRGAAAAAAAAAPAVTGVAMARPQDAPSARSTAAGAVAITATSGSQEGSAALASSPPPPPPPLARPGGTRLGQLSPETAGPVLATFRQAASSGYRTYHLGSAPAPVLRPTAVTPPPPPPLQPAPAGRGSFFGGCCDGVGGGSSCRGAAAAAAVAFPSGDGGGSGDTACLNNSNNLTRPPVRSSPLHRHSGYPFSDEEHRAHALAPPPPPPVPSPWFGASSHAANRLEGKGDVRMEQYQDFVRHSQRPHDIPAVTTLSCHVSSNGVGLPRRSRNSHLLIHIPTAQHSGSRTKPRTQSQHTEQAPTAIPRLIMANISSTIHILKRPSKIPQKIPQKLLGGKLTTLHSRAVPPATGPAAVTGSSRRIRFTPCKPAAPPSPSPSPSPSLPLERFPTPRVTVPSSGGSVAAATAAEGGAGDAAAGPTGGSALAVMVATFASLAAEVAASRGPWVVCAAAFFSFLSFLFLFIEEVVFEGRPLVGFAAASVVVAVVVADDRKHRCTAWAWHRGERQTETEPC